MSHELKDLSPAQVAARVAFGFAAMALVGVMAFFAIRWLLGAH